MTTVQPMGQPSGDSKMRRILMVSPAGHGGTIQYTHNLCNALAEAGHEVVLASSIDCEMQTFPRSYEFLGVFDRFTPRFGPLRRLFARVRSLKPDIIHLQGAQRPEFYWLLLGLLSPLSKARFVWTPQDIRSNSEKPWHGWMQRRNYARMSHVFLNAKQNEAPLRALFGVSSERVTVLSIPDLVAFARRDLGRDWPKEWPKQPSQSAGPIILCFGLIEPRKGIGQLLEAFGQVAQASDARLLIMGKPLTDMGLFTSQLAKLGLPPERAAIIDRYASFEEMNALFEAAHVVALPYVSGWNSGVLASAYGFGVPVVASNVGGFDEVVHDGETGLLVPPSDPAALAEALLRIVQDTDLHRQLAQGAERAGHAASWEGVAETTLAVYDRILSE